MTLEWIFLYNPFTTRVNRLAQQRLSSWFREMSEHHHNLTAKRRLSGPSILIVRQFFVGKLLPHLQYFVSFQTKIRSPKDQLYPPRALETLSYVRSCLLSILNSSIFFLQHKEIGRGEEDGK